MGGGGERTDEYGSDGAVTVDDVQGGGSYGDTLQDQDLGSEGGGNEGVEGLHYWVAWSIAGMSYQQV